MNDAKNRSTHRIHSAEYPLCMLMSTWLGILALVVILLGNLLIDGSIAGKFILLVLIAYISVSLNQIWLENNYCELTEVCNLILRSFLLEKNACNLKTGSFGYLLKFYLSANNGCLFCCQ